MAARGDAEDPGVHVERAQTHRAHPLEPGLSPARPISSSVADGAFAE
jgi:hypothetical protein